MRRQILLKKLDFYDLTNQRELDMNSNTREIKKIFKNIALFYNIFVFIREKYLILRLKLISHRKIFTQIYKNNSWGDKDSFSGSGSNLKQTQIIICELPILFEEFSIKDILDIPCGDFYWMRKVIFKNIKYMGADIVEELINNNKIYEKNNISFKKIDLISDQLPKVDLILCRDCLVHFSYKNIFSALRNICNSGSKYLLLTSFKDHANNYDILTGQWRAINFENAPFNFPKPIKIIVEGCTEGDNKYTDKSLCLWDINEVKNVLKKII
ncbi:class I SAM-dependent methyltransferase [Fluviispira sanaruensis]|uniref:Methyltransferase domain-containing protein n=1 Tax=Fluviispira sanaruensis TaxID=2493639 RepID=A0A4P2VL70_FLUSA|nr:class I SAM-dependent methyltransferase [Fluviispira sanaruensis]BBH54056.1 hypothetical protein JCM31447_25130 [Fluviispira sanaruensis]